MSNIFIIQEGYCPHCGSILPPITDNGSLSCYSCPAIIPIKEFEDVIAKYTVHFNAKSTEQDIKNTKEMSNADGPIVDRKCPKCGNEKMSYATLQLRSADEGQTVFYTCTKCKFKERENS
ncbi:hypothetical protein WA026_007261 [Henosepilachna vigintioctopunctata]|uniref:DNA-directed RNA polymerase subunit n=1 Tax=Henosepilachna vigintioctopunctata TaxID=420089 RepID=A0AAW1UX63_9CUCU